ncbi:amino acid ABC transporter substrate-binding protein [Frankia sp. AgB1.9]|uniref:ABC transporter substrate-binding protein n=1 Tax=unclassified Frankia TaxID=2632575 RepID=UPI00193152BD|nr:MULTISPECIES: ABC transporter substrate-binding protein [unclassified Frankia]MBL7492880.1 amino acid ABC transporter substrate-binding protein [Frankia sp. AgW1.1]MBL7551229.1 amino acid ABC transporter substrate-binding protein [Frankia sp. AgB1.9]MBL7622765.1 amino acid ABC transporter substrate-binding protein [Frankia sp. AgB1.8]
MLRPRPRRSRSFAVVAATATAAAVLALAACASDASPTAAAPSPGATGIAALHLVHPGQLTVATDSPAYDPWFSNNDPANGLGYESAVAYAVAGQLGFTKDQVKWVSEPFDKSFAPGAKNFDFDVNQISITADRKQAVDFSTGYYDVAQAIVALKSSKIAGAKSLADLKDAKLGAPVGTTSLDAITEKVKPTTPAAVFNDVNDAKSALENGQIDGIVVDLPTGFYLTAAEIDNSVIVGQFPSTGTPEQFGLLFEKGNPLVKNVDTALAKLTANGDLDTLQNRYLASAGAPVLK